MTARQKLWLKVGLCLTFPVWIPLMFALVLVGIIPLLVWTMVDEMVDPAKCGRSPPR